jgi:hypothetical protein
MTVPALLDAAPKNYLIDAGVVKIGASLVLVGNSVGGLKWSPGTETRHVQFDGKRDDIQFQHRDIGGDASITGKVLIGSSASIISATPGAESDGSTGVNVITPLDNDLFYPESAYGVDGVYLARRQDNKIFGVLMPVFLMKTTGFQSADKNETAWDVEIKPCIADTTEGGTINLSAHAWRYLEIDELDDLVTYLTALEA